jgi:hypothetical protein
MTFIAKQVRVNRDTSYVTRYIPDLSKFEDTGVLAPFSSAGILRVGDYLYAFGGKYPGSTDSNIIWSTPWNSPLAWSNTGYTLPYVQNGSNPFIIDDYIYLFGDMGSAPICRAHVSDPLYWSKTGFSCNPVNANGNRGYALSIKDNTIYIYQGYNGNTSSGATVSYKANPSNPLVWTQFSQPVSRWEIGAASFNDRFLAFGGSGGSSNLLISENPKQVNNTDINLTLPATYTQTPFAYDSGEDLYILQGNTTAIAKLDKNLQLTTSQNTTINTAGYNFGSNYIGADGKFYYIISYHDGAARKIYRSSSTKVKVKEYSFADNTTTGYTESGDPIAVGKHSKLGFPPWLTNRNDLPSIPQQTPLSKFGTRLKLWLEADRGITLDSSNRVSSWVDQASGISFDQSTAGLRPYYDSKWNGKKVLRFPAVGESLTTTSSLITTRYQKANYQHTFACARFVKDSNSFLTPLISAIGTNYAPIYISGSTTSSYKGAVLESFQTNIGYTTYGREIIEINPGAISTLTVNSTSYNVATPQSDGYTGGSGVTTIHSNLGVSGTEEIACIIDIEGPITVEERAWLDAYLLRWNTNTVISNNFSPKDLGGEWWDFDDAIDDGSNNITDLYGRNNGWLFNMVTPTYRMQVGTWSDGSKAGYSPNDASFNCLQSTDANVLEILNRTSTEATFWCLCKPGVAVGGGYQFLLSSSSSTDSSLNEIAFPHSLTTMLRQVTSSTGAYKQYTTERYMQFGSEYLVGYSQDSNKNDLRMDGRLRKDTTVIPAGSYTKTHAMICGRSAGGALSSYPWNGYIKAFGIIPRKLTDTEWNSILKYYNRNKIEVICNGNSITTGGYSGDIPYPTILQNMLGTKAYVNNLGVGGTITPTITAGLPTSSINYLATTHYNIIWEMTNDLTVLGNGTVAGVLQNHALCVAKARELGIKNIITSTLIPRIDYGIEANRLLVNDALRLNPNKIYGDIVVDLAKRPEFLVHNYSVYYDGAHPNTEGNKIIAQEFFNAIKSLSVSEYKPTEVPGVVLWLKADEGITLDSSNRVSQWDDLSGNNNHCTQSTSGNRPYWNLASDRINGKATVSSSTAGLNYLNCNTLASVFTSQVYTVVAVRKSTSQQVLFAASDNTTAAYDVLQIRKNQVVDDNVSGTATLTVTNNLFSGETIVGYRSTASNQYANSNGSIVTSSSSRPVWSGTPPAASIVTILDAWWGANSDAGSIAEIAIFNRSLSDLEIDNVMAGMNARWNVDYLTKTKGLDEMLNLDPIRLLMPPKASGVDYLCDEGNPKAGAQVAVWYDRAGTNHATSLMGSLQQPTMEVSASPANRQLVRFDCTADLNLINVMRVPYCPALNTATAWTRSISCKINNGAPAGYILANVSFALALTFGGTTLAFYLDGGCWATLATDTNHHIITMVYDGSQVTNALKFKVYMDGVAQTLAFAGTVPVSLAVSQDDYLGSNGTMTQPGNVSIGGIADFSRVLNGTELTTLQAAWTKAFS